jgi:transposase InsO family protein
VVGYLIAGSFEEDTEAIDQPLSRKGFFVVATNVLDEEELPALDLIALYKSQGTSIGTEFRFFKDPLFFADAFFLKTERRIMALTMIMGLALLVYALAEEELRRTLKALKESVPNQKRKPTTRPTMRLIFHIMDGIHWIPARGDPKGTVWMKDVQKKIVAFKCQHPTVGGVRLTYMMLDQGVVAVSPSTVFRVLREAGISSRWTLPDGRKASRQGFHQPQRPHEQWHSDISYINLRGTHYFFISVLDGYSRAIVFWDLCLSMTSADVELVIQRALETLPKGLAKPRIISDNGPQYLSTEFRSALRDQEVVHSRIRVGHPKSNGKIERFPKTLKSECVRTQALGGFEEAKTILATYVHEYNYERLHWALNDLTPADTLKGKETIKQRLERRKNALEKARKDRRQRQARLRQESRSA